MAGNIVKWWKHKILGGYKQFSVLQECTTDSEELMYPVRAPSSCSAPPDLLLVSDRENVQRKSPMNIMPPTKVQQQQHIHSHQQHPQQPHMQQLRENQVKQPLQSKNPEATTNHRPEGTHQKKDDERMHLEEFTCDVSVEGGKSSQPLQFSFTFYDLDGHHGKITKDDIVGIVYTIYESIGKSVVVPHCGSKTINVRLTVSPEGKSKSAEKPRKYHSTTSGQQHSRRQHRYRPRKLIKSDDEDDEGDSGSEREVSNSKKGPTVAKCSKTNPEATSSNQKFCCSEGRMNQDVSSVPPPRLVDTQTSGQSTSQQPLQSSNCKYSNPVENIYESMANLKCCPKESRKVELDGCKECASSLLASQQHYLKQASIRAKILRKARKQKYQEQCYESRQRSLSVGNESCWKSRTGRTAPDEVDGRTVPTAECWNNALKRNDLIDIIRESMEKNRLCFQSNGKTQPNVSPVRHRQRSNTVSKVVDENYPPQTSHHIPIYHQQMAINPAILSQNNGIAHPKTNLCGYDSFLHATICSSVNNATHNQALVPNQQPLVNSPKIYVNSSNLAKSSKLLKNGYQSQQNSPQFHGYQRLSTSHGQEDKLNRTIDHVEKWLHERDQGVIKANDLKILKYAGDESKCKKDVKNYDNLLYSKLTEKLQEIPRRAPQDSNVLNNNKENTRRIHHSHTHHQKVQRRNLDLNTSSSPTTGNLDKSDTSSKFVTLIPIDVDPIECENLIHPTSDEDTLPPMPSGGANAGVNGDNHSGTNNTNNGNNSNSSSMIHRYVHEHIHHHYHHFENKDN